MTSSRAFLLGLLALAVSGCLAAQPAAWTHAPSQTASVERAIYECRAAADAETWRGAAFGGAIVPLVAIAQRGQVFERYMASRGWARRPE